MVRCKWKWLAARLFVRGRCGMPIASARLSLTRRSKRSCRSSAGRAGRAPMREAS